ncbi:MAG: ABC transporter ATP-binding protein [Opitutaceae bacterium]
MAIIETENLVRRFGRAEAVNGLDLTVPEGSVFALLGPNGAGKTTTIKVLMNLLAPSRGAARILGVDSRRLGPDELRRIGYVSENQRLPLWMTVNDLIGYCRPLYPTWDRALEASLLGQFELPMGRPLKHLSRGGIMKAALLVSLAYRPRLLVLDEPFSGLDPLVREDFVSGLLEASANGDWTIFVSSHDIEEVERLCDWIAVLEAGRLRFAESTETLLRRFRRVEAVGAAGSWPPQSSADPSWIGWEETPGLARFIETAFSDNISLGRYHAAFPSAAVSVRPMTLREIFVAQARSDRARRKGGA